MIKIQTKKQTMNKVTIYKIGIMNKFMLGVLCILASTLTLSAQIEPAKALKKAKRAYTAFNMDQANNAASLPEAAEMINIAMEDAEVSNSFEAWELKTQINSTVVNSAFLTYETSSITGNEKELDQSIMTLANIAYDCAMEAKGRAEKKIQKSSMEELWREVGNANYNVYSYFLDQKTYGDAFTYALNLTSVHEELVEMGEVYFSVEGDYKNQLYAAAFCGKAAGAAEAKDLYQRLIDMGTDNPDVYSDLFKILIDAGDEAGGLAVLDKGKIEFPDDQNILYAEINYFLQNNKYEQLVDKLKLAIDKDPENKTLYSTLGVTYEQIYKARLESLGSENEETEMLFESAAKYFDLAITKDATYTDALYGLGALYYNKAAENSEVMRNLGTSAEENKLYDTLKAEMDGLFEKSLPYFQEVEKINANDRNALIALKEIYAKKGDLEKSVEFKNRINVIDGGGSNESSFFN